MSIKQRSGFLTFYLWFMIIGYSTLSMIHIVGLFSYTEYSPILILFLLILSVLGVVFTSYLLKWKKWAFWGIVFIATGIFFMDIISGNFGAGSIKVIFAIGFLYSLLKIPNNGVTAWDNLEGMPTLSDYYSSKVKENSIGKYIKNSEQKTPRTKTPVNEEFSLEDKYNQLKKLGEIFKKGILASEEFEHEKEMIINKSISNDDIIIEKKFELLEKIAELHKEKILSDIEFSNEKKILLDKPKSNTPSTEIINILHKEIRAMKKDSQHRYNENLYNILIESCKTKKNSLELIHTYQNKYKSNLITEITQNNGNFARIVKYLTPFIEQKIVEPNWPHKRIAQ